MPFSLSVSSSYAHLHLLLSSFQPANLSFSFLFLSSSHLAVQSSSRPSNNPQDAMDADDFDFANFPDEDDVGAGGNGGGGAGGGIRSCPHCTFENDHGGDCDVCGLPLDG